MSTDIIIVFYLLFVCSKQIITFINNNIYYLFALNYIYHNSFMLFLAILHTNLNAPCQFLLSFPRFSASGQVIVFSKQALK